MYKQCDRRGDKPTTSGMNGARWRMRNGLLAFREEGLALDLGRGPLAFRGKESKRIFLRICTLGNEVGVGR
jgi:hypothetical protein